MPNDPRVDVQVGIPCNLYRGGTSRGVLMRDVLVPGRDALESLHAGPSQPVLSDD